MKNSALRLVALLGAFLIGLSGLRAQSNTEYSFRQQHTIDGQAYSSSDHGDSVPVLTMDCLAANGYGQWTLSSQNGTGTGIGGATTYPAGWFLLANGLYQPCTHYAGSDVTDYPGCIPPGVVQSASMEPLPNPKATANLDGSVNYVSAVGATFNIEWIGPSDVDLSLSFLSNPTPPMNIVKTTGLSPAPHALTLSTSAHPVFIEGDFRDEFDVCSDATYLYIVWEFMNGGTKEIWVAAFPVGSSSPAFGPIKVDNGSFPTIACDPRNNRGGGAAQFYVAYIDPAGTHVKTALWSGGMFTYSTLNTNFWDPNLANPSMVPYYSALHARIVQSSVLGGASSIGVYAIVTHGSNSTSLIYYSPSGITGPANYVAGQEWAPPSPIPFPPKPNVYNGPIIAFANPYDNQTGWHTTDQIHCVYQYDLGASHSPRYPIAIVRGSDIQARYPVMPDPLNFSTNLVINQSGGALMSDPSGNLTVPINWYVGAVNQMGIHIHWHVGSPGAGTHYYARDMGQTTALDHHISRAFDEEIDENTLVTDQCTVSDGTAHGGTVGATVGGLVGAGQLPNKTMAIWTDPNYGFSLTDPNYGLYQPRTYGITPNPITWTASLDSHVGQLNFVGENVQLNIGDNNLMYPPDNLTDMPYFYFNFLGQNDGATQGVVINGTWNYYGLIGVHNPTTLATNTTSTDYTSSYLTASPFTSGGLPIAYIGSEIINTPTDGAGGNIQIGTSWTGGGELAPYDIPGTLIVHGGAKFFCSENTSFTIQPDRFGTSGNVDVLYDGDVFPINNQYYQISDTTGMLELDGKTYLEGSYNSFGFTHDYNDTSTWWAAGGNIRGHIPDLFTQATSSSGAHPNYQADEVILEIGESWDKTVHTTPTAFDAENFYFYNTNADNPGGKSEIRIGYPDQNEGIWLEEGDANGGDILFDGGEADAVEIHMIDPNENYTTHQGGLPTLHPVNYTIENMYFNDIRGEVILMEEDQINATDNTYYPYEYGHISILNNTFGTWAANAGYPLKYGGSPYFISGIHAIGFNSEGYLNTGVSYAQYGPVDIEGNQFPGPNCLNIFNNEDENEEFDVNWPTCVAIMIENTTANVVSNVISDEGYTLGIAVCESQSLLSPVTSYSLLCSNNIDETGDLDRACSDPPNFESMILTRYGAGKVILNTFKNEYRDFYAELKDNSILLGNSMLVGQPLEIANQSWTDLSGLHDVNNDLAAFNTLNGGVFGAIQIDDASARVSLGKTDPSSTSSNWGHNNFGAGIDDIVVYGSVDLGNIDYNYWGDPSVRPDLYGASPCNSCYWTSSGSWENAFAIGGTLSYVCTTAFTSQQGPPTTTDCGTAWGGLTTNKKSGKHPLSMQRNSDSCSQLSITGHDEFENAEWQQAFDTLRHLVETCPHYQYTPSEFLSISSAMVHIYGPGGGNYRATYEGWLDSVLYLDTTNPEYYCACAEEIAGYLPLPNDTLPGYESRWTNIPLAVLQWLIQNTTCDTPALAQQYELSRQTQLNQWANDPTAYKLDTTLLPLNSIQPGLKELLEKHFLYSDVSERNGPSILSNAAASPNPLITGTIISFGISKEAYVKIEVFDLLGNRVSSAGFESLFEPGNKAVPISLVGLPAGIYFARIVTAYGEVQTVKLVKE